MATFHRFGRSFFRRQRQRLSRSGSTTTFFPNNTMATFSRTRKERSSITMVDSATEYLELGYRPIPLIAWTERAEVKWKEYQARPPNEENVRSWFASGNPNIALLTGNG